MAATLVGAVVVLAVTYLTTKPQAQSDNWKVILRAVERDPTVGFSPPLVPNPNNYILGLTLEITYMGPAGDVLFPVVTIRNQIGNTYNKLIAIKSPEPFAPGWFYRKDSKRLQTGEHFLRSVSLYFEIPQEFTEFNLIIGDVAPIPFSVKRK